MTAQHDGFVASCAVLEPGWLGVAAGAQPADDQQVRDSWFGVRTADGREIRWAFGGGRPTVFREDMSI